MNTEVFFSNKTAEWETPQDLFDKLNQEFHFTLDPCADAQNHKCARYYTKEEDGLSQDWSREIVFCNPPYGREIEAWARKCFTEVYAGDCRCAVLLIPARTDTKWFHAYVYRKAEVRFIRGRLKFGGAKDNAPFPSMIVVFRNCRDEKGRNT